MYEITIDTQIYRFNTLKEYTKFKSQMILSLIEFENEYI
jgi:hypothetical protein